MADAPAALSPYRVLDLTGEIGQYAGRCFAEMGADVIKVEPPQGDLVRTVGPFVKDEAGPERSLLWFVLNASKRGVTCDLERPEGQALFRKLVAETDVVIESYPPGYLDGLGLGYDAFRKEHPKLVWVSVTGFGQDGPYRDYKWSDIVGLALGGMLYLMGEPDRPPARTLAAQAYYHASLGAAVGGMMALYHARRTGAGQRVDASMQEIETFVLAGAGGVTGYWYLEGMNIARSGVGINLGKMISRTLYPCKDGYIAVSTLFGPHFPRLIELLKRDGAAGFLEDEKWRTATRFTPLPGQWQCSQDDANAAEDIFAAWLQRYTRAEIQRMASEHNLLVFPVLLTHENLDREQLKARDFFQRVEQPAAGTSATLPGAPVALSATPWRITGPAPQLGEHNDAVYGEIGVSKDELASLRKGGAI